MDRSNYQTSYGAVYRIVHRLTRNMTMSPQLGWTHSQSESGPIQQEYDMLLTGVAISRSFTRHLSGSLDYRYQNRTSPQPNQSYEVNFVSISLNYTF
jgi:uncharacterized protein (PEP-CTERM system associated)